MYLQVFGARTREWDPGELEIIEKTGRVSGFDQPATVRISSVNVPQDTVGVETALTYKRESFNVFIIIQSNDALGFYQVVTLTDVSSDFIETWNRTDGQREKLFC